MRKIKNYTEDTDTLEWLTKNVPKQKESQFIREAVKEKIAKVEKKKLSTVIHLHN